MNHDPTLPLGVATKQYVDSILGSAGGYVAKSGDTMTGPLRIFEPGPSSDLILDSSSGLGTSNNIFGQTLGVTRWTLAIGNYTDETGDNAGSDFEIMRHDDAGGYLDSPFLIARSNGYVTISTLTVGPESSNGFLTLNKSTGSSTIRGARIAAQGCHSEGGLLALTDATRTYAQRAPASPLFWCSGSRVEAAHAPSALALQKVTIGRGTTGFAPRI